MSEIRHHISEPLIAAYVAGNVAQPYALVIAAHVSMCEECRARMAAHEMAGGAVLEATDGHVISTDLRAQVLDALDHAAPNEAQAYQRSGIFPAPVMEALKGKPPKWKSLGFGVRQSILQSGDDGSVRLLYIPAGQEMPNHSHDGLELTLVLQGAFSDEDGRFGVGDVEVADDDVDHAPVAEAGEACICLAATGAPLKFRSWMPRLLQPLFRI
ncbi:ChrR family anti-sigma-E factor [Cognatishimia sp. SS12]|uniref:ChrR family anti-sigma-E factor n=1 Tax=Cognatishimia sp. SS12 TaxID=2979465 RepID=UPI00232BBE52|nr:ChrR family anti-sigma-E factor [Cognatishimia sp. SS12]MDC0739433.1 ChrR family anti-sigma-E factor [Cognatishimia sp. SS12]